MSEDSHGNAKSNKKLHHLYEIRDREEKDIFKYGICGRKLKKDDSSKRASEQVSLFNRVVGWTRFYANVLIKNIPGNRRAREIEDEHIDAYEKIHGRRPRGNQ